MPFGPVQFAPIPAEPVEFAPAPAAPAPVVMDVFAPSPSIAPPVRPNPVTKPVPPPSADAIPATPLSAMIGTLPYPVASVLREYRQAQDTRDQYDAMLKLAETLAVTVCVTAAALLRAGQDSLASSEQQCARAKSLGNLYATLLGKSATFGTWTNWLGVLARRPPGSMALSPEFDDALRDDGDNPGLVTCLNALREERNRSAHGEAPQSFPEFGLRVSQAGPHLETALQKAVFLEQLPWLLTKSSDYRPRAGSFDVAAFVAMGDHPDFELRHYDFKVPLGTDMFYILDNGQALPLSPLIARRYCVTCLSLEVCYVSHVHRDSGMASLRSFHRGHEISDRELGEEITEYA